MTNSDVSLNGHTYTFLSGVTLHLKPVSPYLLQELRSAFTKPLPPQQEIDYGESKRVESNPLDPDYILALAEYESRVQDAGAMEMIRRGVVLDDDEVNSTVSQLRDEWRNRYQSELSESDDRLAYLKYVCFGGSSDLLGLLQAIRRLSHPSEAAIAETTATFPG